VSLAGGDWPGGSGGRCRGCSRGTIVLTLALGKDIEGVIITVRLVLNSVVGFLQQSRADEALELLRQRLAVNARVRRDGAWMQLPARELVPGDVVRVRVGDLVPADLVVVDGDLSLDPPPRLSLPRLASGRPSPSSAPPAPPAPRRLSPHAPAPDEVQIPAATAINPPRDRRSALNPKAC